MRSRFNNDLPEGVDFSDSGSATDFAVSLMGFLFFVSGLLHYEERQDQQTHFLYLFTGTSIAHLFGGLAHRFYPNRASDGVGMVGFYVTTTLGYGGNCLRFAMGWDLQGFPMLGIITWVFLVVTAMWTLCTMERTNHRVDEAETTGFKPDIAFAAGELAVALLEMTAGVVFLWEQELTTDPLALTAVASNIVGWMAVYVVGGVVYALGFDYNPSPMQRIFHYAMMVMLWTIHEYSLSVDR